MDKKTDAQSLRESIFNEPVFTTEEVAIALRIQKTTVREKIRRGELLALPMGSSYLITQTALRSFKRTLELKAILARRQVREPQAAWDMTDCISCGESPVLTTSHIRLEGLQIVCESCKDRGLTQLDQDAWERLVPIKVTERNKLSDLATQEARQEDPHVPEPALPPWRVDHCAICHHPYPLSVADILSPGFHPTCAHELPFRNDNPRSVQLEEHVLLTHLTSIEVEARNWLHSREPDDDYWQVVQCTFCGELPAVSSESMRLMGYAMCRLCFQTTSPFKESINPTPALQLELVKKALRIYGFAKGTTIEYSNCCWDLGDDLKSARFDECGTYEIVETYPNNRRDVILTWCTSKSLEERDSIARNYIKSYGLTSVFAERLLAEVRHEITSHSPGLKHFVKQYNR